MLDVDPKQPYIIKVKGLLTPGECGSLIAKIESLNPVVAPINTRSGTAVRTDVRNNDRVIFDDEEWPGRYSTAYAAGYPEKFTACRL